MPDRIQRALRRAWRNDRGGRWTRRVRWYEFRSNEGVSIRLNFAERQSFDTPRRLWVEVNTFYSDDESAERDVQRFAEGERAATFRNEQE